MSITGYSPEVNDLYSSGFSTATPVRNADASFVGAGYDWTGIGWVSDSPSGRITHVTMITPLHTLSARHASVSLLGTQVRLVNNDGDVLDIALQGTSTLAATTPAGDLNIAALERAVTASEGIAPLRLLDIAGGNYINQPLLMLGSNGGVSRVATSAVWTQGTNTAGASLNLLNSAHSFQAWESGDSGSPALIAYDGSLMVAGTAWYPYSFASLFETSTYTPAAAINGLLADTGYALKWTIYDNPSDSANTANVWSGGAGTGTLNTAGNWLNPAAPVADQPVVFDADAANGQTALALDAGLSLRGILFRASESSSAFSFGGAHTLVIGQTGIRNESAATQTFNLPIALSGAQNWEAVNGDLAFNGPIDNAGHLLAVGGAADTTITGVISGSGGLAKDDSGTLTLAAANTYAGTTFLHDGTLRLAPGGGLGAGAVAFIAGNAATLDLNGQNQTVAGLTSDHGGTGRVLLGGATLTVNNAATGRYDGSIEGAGSLVKTDAGLWILSGENTHTGPTRLEGGVLRLSSADALSANSNLAFNGGILELGAGDFTRSLGTGAGQVQFTGVGVGGFSAHGGTRVVNLGGEGAEVAWGVGGFVPDATGFRLSATTSDSTLEFQNAINLGGAYRNIVVNNGTAAIDARTTGVIRNGSLVKHGSGVLELTALNTYAGHTQINDGALLISTEGALAAGNLVFVGSGGGVLALGSGDFTRELGNGDNLVRFVTGGGFAAVGADRVVNLGGAGATVTWGQGDFVPNGNLLVLSSGSISDAMVDFQNAIDLNGGDRTFQIGDGTARIDSRLSGVLGNGGIIKTGGGTLELTAANTYAGQTFVNGGVLLASHASALGSGNLRLASGGVFMMGAGDFTRALGTGADQVQFTGSGGFAARGVDRVVNLGGAGATVTWGSAGFVPLGSALYLGANSADATVDFVNPVNLAGASRTMWVYDGSAAIDARLRGALSNGGLTKGGAGVLELAVANTYAGQTRVNGGVLLLAHADALPDASALAFSESGVLGLATGDFTRSLGTGAGQLQFIGSGGFAAYGADRAVNLGGAGATVTWGIANTGINGRLVLSSASADGTLNWQNSINLGTSALGTRIIEVHDGSAEVDARMNGVIYTGGVGWGVEKAGAGTLEFAAGTSYTGATLVSAGRLIVGAGGTMTATSGITVKTGAIFDYRSSVAALGRAVTVDGGAFLYNSTSAYTGALTFTSGLIGGSGNLGSTALTIGAGRTIAPGNGAGTLRTGSQTWENGGVYQWEIVSLDGAAGQADGWDLLQIQGDLNILADAGGFTIRLESTDSLTGWDKGSDYIWTIATVVGSALGGDPLLATIDAAGFSTHNDLGGGRFGLQLDGSDLNLVFTAAIPETCTSLIPLLAFLATAFRRGGRRPSRASVASVRPQARSLGRRAPARGFALLVTITLVAFLVLILVSLATFTRIETQVAANTRQSEQARQHALMSLGIAVGQLQKFTGPDQRVTAAAALGDGTNGLAAPRDGTRFWTGVWGNRNSPGDDLAR
ncbi:MAG: autotransporter-associated beta strand repeat-containing protein, partial [Verrucomicrobiota bacterium]